MTLKELAQAHQKVGYIVHADMSLNGSGKIDTMYYCGIKNNGQVNMSKFPLTAMTLDTVELAMEVKNYIHKQLGIEATIAKLEVTANITNI